MADTALQSLLKRLDVWQTPDGLDVEPRHALSGGEIQMHPFEPTKYRKQFEKALKKHGPASVPPMAYRLWLEMLRREDR